MCGALACCSSILHLCSAVVWCSCILLSHGALVWRPCMVQLCVSVVWCSGVFWQCGAVMCVLQSCAAVMRCHSRASLRHNKHMSDITNIYTHVRCNKHMSDVSDVCSISVLQYSVALVCCSRVLQSCCSGA